MHIPKNTEDLSSPLPFREALLEENSLEVPYDKKQWLYVPCRYLEYRYILGTRGVNPLICIGINPSTAEPGNLDNTLKSVDRISRGNGYDSFIMFNVYAQRATDPNAMSNECSPALHRENMEAFRYVLSSYGEGHSPAVWAAWGTVLEKRAYLLPCLAEMVSVGEEYHAVWYSVGARSKAGHPHHPLYLRRDSIIDPFDVREYLSSLKK